MSHRLRGCRITLLVRRPKSSNNSSMHDGEKERERKHGFSFFFSLFFDRKDAQTLRRVTLVASDTRDTRLVLFPSSRSKRRFLVNSSGRVRKRARLFPEPSTLRYILLHIAFISLNFEKAVNRLIESRFTIEA